MSDTSPTWHRLHWSSLIFQVLTRSSQILLPGLLVIFFGGGEWQKWLMVLFPLVMIGEVIGYISIRYRTEADELIVKRGIIWKNVRNIPCERIQNLDLSQNPLHRMLGVAEVRVETASGSEPEAVLKVLSLDAIDELRSGIFKQRSGDAPDSAATPGVTTGVSEPAEDEGDVLLRVSREELARLGIISNRGLALVAIVIGIAFQFDFFKPTELFGFIERNVESIDVDSVLASGLWGLIVGIVGLALVLLLYFALSIVMTLLRLDGFTLRRSGDDLRISCGMFTRISTTVPRRRVQTVTVIESALHRLLGRVTVRVQTAGAGQNDGKEVGSRRWFIPIARPDEVPALMRAAGLDHGLDRADWIPPAPGARRRMMKKNAAFATVMSGIGLALWFPWGALVMAGVLIPGAVWLATREVRRMAHARVDDCLLYRSGVLNRRINAVRTSKIQAVTLAASPFDRRHGMASLLIDTAGAGPIAQSIQIPYVRADDAERLGAELVERAEDEGFVW